MAAEWSGCRMERIFRVQTVKLVGQGLSSTSPERRRKARRKKRVIPCKDRQILFGAWGCERLRPPESEILGPCIGISSMNSKKMKHSFNTRPTMPIMTKFLHGIPTMNGPSWVVPRLHPTKMADGGLLDFVKCQYLGTE